MTDWPHAPIHRLNECGAYIITAGTFHKQHLFDKPEKLDILQKALFKLALHYGLELQAWAIFSNHYHTVLISPDRNISIRRFITHLHASTAKRINAIDDAEGRRVWFNFWDTYLDIETSYLARLNYVHQNPVKHGLVKVAEEYPWCSASWFERNASTSFYKTVCSFKTDRISIRDDY
jgi:putative transposase